jgi:hypothetical protein
MAAPNPFCAVDVRRKGIAQLEEENDTLWEENSRLWEKNERLAGMVAKKKKSRCTP